MWLGPYVGLTKTNQNIFLKIYTEEEKWNKDRMKGKNNQEQEQAHVKYQANKN